MAKIISYDTFVVSDHSSPHRTALILARISDMISSLCCISFTSMKNHHKVSPSASGSTPAIRVSPPCPPVETPSPFSFDRSSNGALPQQAHTPVPKAAMIYNLLDTHPTKAVDTPDNRKGVDGDSGGTAGTPLIGVEAISAFSSQTCETLLQCQSPGVDTEPRASCTSRASRDRKRQAALPPSNTGDLGNAPSCEGGSTAHHTINTPTEDSPEVALKKRAFRIGTWNTRGKTDPSGRSKFNTAKMIMKLEKVDILVITETHTKEDSPPDVRGLKVLAHTGISNNRAGVAICALDTGIWSCASSEILIPGHAVICELYHSVSTESFRILGVYGDISDYSARTDFY